MPLKKYKQLFFNNWPSLLALLVLFLRLPALFEPFTYGDEGIYLTLCQAIRQGLLLYQEIHDNKPPLIYLIAAFAPTFPLYRLLAFLYSWLVLLFFYQLARQIFPQQKKAVIASCFAFGILYSLPFLEGNIANAENFLIGLTLPAFWFLLKQKFFLAGLLFSLATLFKVPAAFDFIAAIVFISLVSKKLYSLFIIHYSLFIGFATPLLVSLFFFWSKNALPAYLAAAFAQNLPYLSSWIGPATSTGLPLVLLARGLLLFLLLLLLFFFRQRLAPSTLLVSLWFAFTLFAALLSGRPYPHYLLQTVPALSLAFGFFLSKKPFLPLLALLAFILSWGTIRFWYYLNLPYYFNFYFHRFATQYQAAHPSYQAAAYLRQRTTSKEKIFIWGNQPQIYSLAHRLPLGRYTVAYHIIDFNGYRETLDQLQSHPPRYLIVDQNEKRPFPEFFFWLNQNYSPEVQFGPLAICHRH